MKVTINLSPDLLQWISDNAEHAGRARKTEIEHMLRGCMAKGLDASQLPFPRAPIPVKPIVEPQSSIETYINRRGETITDPEQIKFFKEKDAKLEPAPKPIVEPYTDRTGRVHTSKFYIATAKEMDAQHAAAQMQSLPMK